MTVINPLHRSCEIICAFAGSLSRGRIAGVGYRLARVASCLSGGSVKGAAADVSENAARVPVEVRHRGGLSTVLAACRWPDGFVCPRCGNRRAYELANLWRWQCSAC